MKDRLLITNCRLFDAGDGHGTYVLVEDGIIARIGDIDATGDCKNVLDAQGHILAPGFIDVHIQGAGGADVLDATTDALTAISRTSARFGVTGFLATTVFKPDKPNLHIDLAADCLGSDLGGANLLGIHLEGPFISLEKRGMIQPDCTCPPSADVLNQIMDMSKGSLRMMTIAPELPQSAAMIRKLADSNVVASFGHSNATYEQTLAGFDAGISHVTHLFNAMPSIHHRSPGPLIAVFETRHITAQIIPDGVHIQPPVLRFTFDTLGPDRTIPITDGMQAIGLADGKYVYNGLDYESKNGTARYEDGTLIGTALGLSQLLGRFITLTKCSLETAIKMVTVNPASLLGIQETKGSINIGKDADLVLLDAECNVHATIVGGKIVFKK
ncbi:MAG: N-acetylglucosamine-6-phosphate deacetylase [Sedimentisphaerales bacterium]|nr:N-acetylglucosamine-6-phosphate deacetylase [Sedimentisphaerales bacterium]